MPQTPTANQKPEPRILNRLWPPLLFALGCVLVAGVYYFFYVDKKSTYLMSRDFRYLATIAQQTREAMERQGTVFTNLALKEKIAGPANSGDKDGARNRARYLRDLVPLFENVTPSRADKWGSGNILHRLEKTVQGIQLHFFYFPKQDKAFEDAKPFILNGTIRLEDLLGAYFQPRDAFESILLAEAGGKVIYQYQEGTQDLSIARLDELAEARRARFRKTSTLNDAEMEGDVEVPLFVSSDYFDVELSGRSYRAFIQPLDLPLSIVESKDPPDATTVGKEKAWLLCGLVSRKTFVYKSMAVSSALILSCIGVLLLGILSWPFVKLRLIGERQRVGVFDVLLIGLCSLLVIAVLTVFLLDLFAFSSLKELAANQAETLAARMVENIQSEIRAAYQQLKILDLGSSKGEVGQDSHEVGNILAGKAFDLRPYPFMDIFSMLDRSGFQKRKWSIDGSVSAQFTVERRSYFRKVVNQDTWSFSGSNSGIPIGPFVLEPIVGWGNGVKATVLSVPTNQQEYPVATLSIPMLSLIDPVLPPGFVFAVIDTQGKVLFHSDSQRNQAENLFVETDQDRHLRSSVFARRDETLRLRYWGEDYIAHTSPIEGLPWTLVALREMKILRSVNIEWISSTLIFLFLYLGAFASLLALIAGIRPDYRAGWAWPVSERAGDYFNLAALYLLLVGISLISIVQAKGGVCLLAISWMLPAQALTWAYLTLETHGQGPKRVVLATSGVLLGIGHSVCLFLAPVESGASVWPSRAAALLLLGTSITVVMRPTRQSTRIPWTSDARSWRRFRETVPISRSYPLVGALLLLLSAALPTAGLFKVAHRIQIESFVKHGQLRLAMSLKERAMKARQRFSEAQGTCKSRLLEDRLAVRNKSRKGLAGLDVYASPFFETEVGLPSLPSEPAPECNPTKVKYLDMVTVRSDPPPSACNEQGNDFALEDLLPYASELSAETHELQHEKSSDDRWKWQECGGDRLSLASSDYPTSGETKVVLESRIPRSGWRAALFPIVETRNTENAMVAGAVPSLGVMFRLLGVFFFASLVGGLVLFISRRIFLTDLCEPLWLGAQGSSTTPVGRNVFWVGRYRPSEEEERLLARVDLSAVASSPEEWANQLANLVDSCQPILVEGFETGLADRETRERKLDRLEDLIEIEDRTVVVVSRVSPIRLFSRETRISRHAQNGDVSLQERWRALLGAFTIVEENLRVGASRPAHQSTFKEFWAWLLLAQTVDNNTLREEGAGDELLQRIAKDLKGQVSGMSREQILEEFCDRADKYYRALWASCSTEEKVVLEHLAEEGLVNSKSRKTVRRLMARGLIRRAPNLRLMNETFRRFVVSSTCRDQVLTIESTTAPSAWDRFRWPFFAALIAAILFFFATQQEALESTLATFAGATAGLPALVKIIEMFGGRPKMGIPK